MKREELIKKVALKMDEISSSDDIIVPVNPSDNNPLYAQIDGLLNESINEVLTKAPIHRIKEFTTTKEFMSFTTVDSAARRGAISVDIPDKFLRLISITHEDFKRPIVELAIEGDEISKRQSNKFLMAKESKPVGVIRRGAQNKLEIVCYSILNKDEMQNATLNYIERFTKTGLNEEICSDDYLLDIISWVCAGKAFATHGDISKSQSCDTNAASLMI